MPVVRSGATKCSERFYSLNFQTPLVLPSEIPSFLPKHKRCCSCYLV